jgi:hypothetical protein
VPLNGAPVACADVESQQHLDKYHVALRTRRRLMTAAVVLWTIFLTFVGAISSIIPEMRPYQFLLWTPFMLTILGSVMVCTVEGRKSDGQILRECRVNEMERRRRRCELPSEHFFEIDETAQLGHSHPVIMLLPPPPKYEAPMAMTEVATPAAAEEMVAVEGDRPVRNG